MTITPAVEVGLGFGSNMGDRIANLTAAKNMLQAIDGIEVVAQSSLYETEPVGVKPEFRHMKFINAVIILSSKLPVEDVHKQCVRIEKEIGRCRTEDRYAPRPLDIDVLYADAVVSDAPGLRLPHPQCLKRRFVLEPLSEVRPELVLPTTSFPVSDLLASLPADEGVVRLTDEW